MSRSPLNVLVVEDNDADARIIQYELRKAGFIPQVTRVQSEAEYVSHLVPAPDVILCDYSLPQFSALRALEILNKSGLEIPFIIVSGSIGEELAVKGVQAGAHDYLLKDRLGRLGTSVRQAIAQRVLREAEKKAKKAELRSITRLNLALDATQIGVWEWDLKTDNVYWSPRCLDLLGDASFEGTFAGFKALIHPDDSFQFMDAIATAIETQGVFSSEFRTLWTGQELQWLSCFGRSESDGEGCPVRVIGTIQNITRRKRGEEVIANSEARLRETLDTMLEGCQILNAEYRFLYLNAAAARHGRRKREELLGQSLIDLYPGIEHTAVFDAIKRCSLHRVSSDLVSEFQFPDGTEGSFELSIHPVPEGVLILSVETTERRRAEQALKASEAQYRVLAESLPQLVWMTDAEGRIEYLNNRCYEYSGLRFEDLADWNWWEVVHPEDRPETSRQWALSLASGIRFEVEYRLKRADGEFRWHMVRGVPLRNEHGHISNWFGTCTDMHDQKLTEAALRESEERLSMSVRAANEGIWDFDPRKGRLWWNPTYETMLGERPPEIVSNVDWWIDRLHPEDRAHVHYGLLKAMAGPDDRWSSEYRLRRPDGTYAEVYDRAVIARAPDGTIKRVLGAMLDLTERRRAEVLFRSVMKSVPDAIITISETAEIKSINPATVRLFGYDTDELVGQDIGQIVFGSDRIARDFFKRITGMATSTEGKPIELRFKRKDESNFPGELTITDFLLEDCRYHTCVIRDVSERKKLEAQFLQAQKMEAVGQLAGGVAHDFNNLLMVISGYSEMLIEQSPPDGSVRESAMAIQGAATRAAGLTRQLLAFSRKQILEPVQINMNELVTHSESLIRRLIRENVIVHVRLDRNLPPVKADPVQMDQVLLNLVVNARDAMPEGGHLTIETSQVEVTDPLSSSEVVLPLGLYVQLSVSDTGCGMSEAIRSRIFEPFFTTKEVGKGTGLGLAVVHGIVQQSGGQIRIRSELGIGTTFEILIPAEPVRHTVNSAGEIVRDESVGTETVLLVEDESAVREIARHILESRGYHVLEAAHGTAAIEVAARHVAPIDLLLTDLVMPQMGGRQLAEIMRTRQPGLRVLFMSGYTDDAEVIHRIHEATDTLIQKPFTPKMLAKKVREILDA